jgi:hypothetical protein
MEHQTPAPEKVNCWDTFKHSTPLLGIMMNRTKLRKVNCWDTYFQQFYLYVDNDGAQPAAPEKANCWDTFTQHLTCRCGYNGGTNLQQKKVNTVGILYQQFLVLG